MPTYTVAPRVFSPIVCIVGLAVVGLVAAGSWQAPSPVVAWATAASFEHLDGETSAVVLETQPADVPALSALLRTGTERQQVAAGLALGYAGGDEAIAALEAADQQGGAVKIMLAFARGMRGTAGDRAFLIGALDREHFGGEWPSVVAAIHALGVLRATEATSALEREAVDDGSSTAHAAREALRWMRQGAWNVDALPAASDEDRIIAAALHQGLPRTAVSSYFNDEKRGGVWVRDGAAWRFRAGARTADGPSLGFTVKMNERRTRALLSVSIVFGMLDGSGYGYVLAREADGWRVRGVMVTWIS
jgi:hypothetical protein